MHPAHRQLHKLSSIRAKRRSRSRASTSTRLMQSFTQESRAEGLLLKLKNSTVKPGGLHVGTRCLTSRMGAPNSSVIPAHVSPESEKQKVANLPRVGFPR